MSNNILNEELSQMKYLFGYRAGKVISEQAVPVSASTETLPGYKLGVIKNQDDLKKFFELNYQILKTAGLSKKLDELMASYNKTKDQKDRYAYSEILKDTQNLVRAMLSYAASQGLNGTDFNRVQNEYILRLLNNLVQEKPTNMSIPDFIDSNFGAIEWFKEGVSKLIDSKIKEMGG